MSDIILIQKLHTKWVKCLSKDDDDIEEDNYNMHELLEKNGYTLGIIIDSFFAEDSYDVFYGSDIYIFNINIAELIKFNILVVKRDDEIKISKVDAILAGGNYVDCDCMNFSNFSKVDINYDMLKKLVVSYLDSE